MAPVLIAGFVIWCMAVFFATRAALRKGNHPLEGFFNLLRKVPGLLFIGGALLEGVGAYFLYLQIQLLHQQTGIIGPQFMMAIVAGVIGSILMAAVRG